MRPNRFLSLTQDLFCAFLLLIVCSLQVAFAYSQNYVLSQHCGEVIDMEERQLSTLTLLLTDAESYLPRMRCSVALRAPPQQQLAVVAQWVDIAAGRYDGHCFDYLSLWNGIFRNRTGYVYGLDNKVCGQSTLPSVTSLGPDMTVHFDSNSVGEGRGFSLVITAFHLGECTDGEFSCNNGRCIDEQLKCDDVDHCGDNSDHCVLTVGPVVLVVILLSILFIIIVGAVLIYRHTKSKQCSALDTDADGVYQPTTEPVTASTSADSSTLAV